MPGSPTSYLGIEARLEAALEEIQQLRVQLSQYREQLVDDRKRFAEAGMTSWSISGLIGFAGAPQTADVDRKVDEVTTFAQQKLADYEKRLADLKAAGYVGFKDR